MMAPSTHLELMGAVHLLVLILLLSSRAPRLFWLCFGFFLRIAYHESQTLPAPMPDERIMVPRRNFTGRSDLQQTQPRKRPRYIYVETIPENDTTSEIEINPGDGHCLWSKKKTASADRGKMHLRKVETGSSDL